MSKEIYLYSEDKKYKCAVELADTFNRFRCPDHSRILLIEERPDGTYIIADAKDRILETEKDKQIAYLQHRLKVAERVTKLACEELRNLNYRTFDNADIDFEQQFKDQAEKEVKGE